MNISNKEDFLKKRAEFFYRKKRNRAILDAWNIDAETLEAIGRRHSITRERVRQILEKAKRYGLKVSSHQERKSIKDNIRLKRLVDSYKKQLIENFSKKSLSDIRKLLKISDSDLKFLKDSLIESGELVVPLKKNFERYNKLPKYRQSRRQSILDLKNRGFTINQIAEENSCSTATIANEIKQMSQSRKIIKCNLNDLKVSFTYEDTENNLILNFLNNEFPYDAIRKKEIDLFLFVEKLNSIKSYFAYHKAKIAIVLDKNLMQLIRDIPDHKVLVSFRKDAHAFKS